MRSRIYLSLVLLPFVAWLPGSDLAAQARSNKQRRNALAELSSSFQAVSERVSPGRWFKFSPRATPL